MKKENDWLKGLQDKMKGYEEPAPEGLWGDVESSIFPERKRGVIAMPVFRRVAAVAAAVALGVFTGLRIFNFEKPSDDDPRRFLASGQSSSVISAGGRESSVEIVDAQAGDDLVAEAKPVSESLAVTFSGSGLERDEPVVYEKKDETQVTELSETSGTDPGPVAVTGSALHDAETQPDIVSDTSSSNHEGEDWSGYLSATEDTGNQEAKTAAVNMSLAGSSTDARRESVYDLQMFYRGSAPASANGLIPDNDDYSGDGSRIQSRGTAPRDLVDNSTTVTSNVDHRRPVRFALTLIYPFSRTLGVESGLAYTILKSTFSNEVGSTVSTTEQTLRYLGVPVSVSASLLDTKRVSLYAIGGGMVEKCLAGKSVTTDVLSGVRQGDLSKKELCVKPLLWSLNASLGVQANLTRRLGVYVEPGLSYHFDDGSDVQTIYKERPLDFMLTFGARFSLK